MAVERPNLLDGEQFPPAPKQARSRQKREALLAAALALFGERGYEAVSIEEITHRAGIAVGAFYQHFASKQQIVLILMDHLLHEMAALTTQISAVDLSDVRGVIAALVRQAILTDRAYAGAYRAWREAIIHNPDLRILHDQIERWTASQLEVMIAMLIQAPGARRDVDAPRLAYMLNLLFWRLIEAPLDEPAAVEGAIVSVTDLIYHALFADTHPTTG